jgi:purine-binding chemotaxis protein CheW
VRMMITKGAATGSAGSGRGLLGLIVDRVDEVRHLPIRDIEPAPDAAMGEHAGIVTGMGKVGDRLIILLNSTGILSREERSALAEAEHAGS